MSWLLRRRRWLEIALVALVIAFAAARRLEFLDQRPMWVDEAESSINALTILQHGVPVDHYLGLPIYENTLVKRWPGNQEYEFKDISYSDRGLATYHGWLPLYAMAASFALNKVAPDETGSRLPHRTLDDLKLRSKIARLPAVFFSIVFLALCYWGGSAMFGRDAGLAALIAGCLHQTQMDLSTTARYYSATVALSTAAVLCLWLMLRKHRWRDYVLGAFVFALLFFTHLVTFAAGAAVFCGLALYQLGQRCGAARKLALFCAILAALTVPWLLATGFLSGLGLVPPARTLLSFPQDFFQYPPAKVYYFICFGVVAALAALTSCKRFAVPERCILVVRQAYAPVLLLLAWIVSGYVTFLLLMPAASFFPERLNLSYWGPMLLLGSILCTALCRILLSRITIVAAPILTLVVLTVTGHDLRAVPSPDNSHKWEQYAALNAYLDSHSLPRSARLFASPNEHLTLTFYTGRPFQSIAPVRKSFLEACRDEIIYVERTAFLPNMPRGLDSRTLSGSDAALFRTYPYRRSVNIAILGLAEDNAAHPASALPPAAEGVEVPDLSIPIFRGFRISTWDEWRAVFFYRYSNPMSRTGRNKNYAGRLRGSEADLLASANWAIYYSKPADSPRLSGVNFRVLP